MLTQIHIESDFFNKVLTFVRKSGTSPSFRMRDEIANVSCINLISYYSMEMFIKKYYMYLKLKAEFEC